MNPLKKIRLDNHLTQKEIARDLGITPQVILRVEQGLFSAPPPDLIIYLSHRSLDGTSPSELTTMYYRWVFATRQTNSESLPVARARKQFINWNHVTSRRVSWKEFRKNILGLSVASTAKLMVIQISLLQDLEKTGRNAAQVRDIISEWGVPIDAVNFDPPNIVKRNNVAELNEL